MNTCPHCRKTIPWKLYWASIFAGQTAHDCPHCKKRFRLTYQSKRRLAFLNIVILLGFLISAGLAIWGVPHTLRNLAVYFGVVSLVLVIMPSQVAYQKTRVPYR